MLHVRGRTFNDVLTIFQRVCCKDPAPNHFFLNFHKFSFVGRFPAMRRSRCPLGCLPHFVKNKYTYTKKWSNARNETCRVPDTCLTNGTLKSQSINQLFARHVYSPCDAHVNAFGSDTPSTQEDWSNKQQFKITCSSAATSHPQTWRPRIVISAFSSQLPPLERHRLLT